MIEYRKIEYRSEIPDPDRFFALFETTGWNLNYKATPQELAAMLANTWYMLAAYDGEHLVGFGRLVSDLVLHAMIYDMIVLPGYQGQGIGGEILSRLVEKCLQHGIRDIQLFCARGKRPFYEGRDFVTRPDDAPGMQYRRPL
jgi:GNAT superfamily N-acetyltransferase